MEKYSNWQEPSKKNDIGDDESDDEPPDEQPIIKCKRYLKFIYSEKATKFCKIFS